VDGVVDLIPVEGAPVDGVVDLGLAAITLRKHRPVLLNNAGVVLHACSLPIADGVTVGVNPEDTSINVFFTGRG